MEAIGLLFLQLVFVQCILWRENIVQQEVMLIMYQVFSRIQQYYLRTYNQEYLMKMALLIQLKTN